MHAQKGFIEILTLEGKRGKWILNIIEHSAQTIFHLTISKNIPLMTCTHAQKGFFKMLHFKGGRKSGAYFGFYLKPSSKYSTNGVRWRNRVIPL